MLTLTSLALPLVLALTAPAPHASAPVSTSTPVLAKAKPKKADEAPVEAEPAPEEAEPAKEVEQREVKYGGADIGTSVGGATGFVFKKGFYAQSDMGGFLRFGGWTNGAACARCQEVATSNLQPYIGFSVGYDF